VVADVWGRLPRAASGSRGAPAVALGSPGAGRVRGLLYGALLAAAADARGEPGAARRRHAARHPADGLSRLQRARGSGGTPRARAADAARALPELVQCPRGTACACALAPSGAGHELVQCPSGTACACALAPSGAGHAVEGG
jgi:hypothetical protein